LTTWVPIVAGSAVAFGVTYFLVPRLIPWLEARGIRGVDVHKRSKPVRAEMGGLAILLGFVAGFGVAFLCQCEDVVQLIGSFLTILLVGLTGCADDMFNLGQRYKFVLCALASLPLMLVFNLGSTLWFPLIGFINLGLALRWLAIPLGVTTASNLTNMLAGFNGLEAGMGVIACGSMGVLCAAFGRTSSALLAFVMFAAFLAFMRYNWYPATIFPGDTGTLLPGAALACVGIFSRLEFAAISMVVPAAIDFALKMISRNPFSHRRIYGDSVPLDDGTILPPNYPALTHAFLNVSRMNEKKLVTVLLLVEALFALLGVLLTIALV